MQIHATNISGLGASHVVSSFLEAYLENGNSNSLIYLPSSGPLLKFDHQNGLIKRYNRLMPNAVSRFIECYFSYLIFADIETIVLGDIPLRKIKNQIVLVHQPNLIYPKINRYSSKALKYRVNRFLFSLNFKYAKKIIVQTDAMADDLIKSYPKIKNKVIVSPQPVPNWLQTGFKLKMKAKIKEKLILFYPSAFYPHKKHDFLLSINKYIIENEISFNDVEIWLTIDEENFRAYRDVKFIKNLGQLSPSQMIDRYSKADALLFISSVESYGLPLVEAIHISLPAIVVDFSYSRCLFQDQAYYFQPYSEKSFVDTIKLFKSDHVSDKYLNYASIKTKFPKNWNEVVDLYLDELKQ